MRRLGVLILVLGTSCAALHAQQLAPGPATEERPTARSSYDPMARGKGTVQPKGIVETTLAGVNPQNTDYGIAVADWREEVFENTLRQFYFWSLLSLTLIFGASLMANGWFMRERERRLTISADLIAQLYNAYVTSRARAFEVIGKHDRLVEKYNRLDEEATALRAARTVEHGVDGQVSTDFVDAKESKAAEIGDGKEMTKDPTIPADLRESAVAAESEWRTQLEELTTKLKRRDAQLQAKENQITNLRSRLNKAHDSLQQERGQNVAGE
jgi:hypothetical protein